MQVQAGCLVNPRFRADLAPFGYPAQPSPLGIHSARWTSARPCPIAVQAIHAGLDTGAAQDEGRPAVEVVELMVASNTITVAHVDALLKATPPEQRTDFKPTERDR
jgi:GTP cyclohydrolase III